jgi:hypothetical protein
MTGQILPLSPRTTDFQAVEYPSTGENARDQFLEKPGMQAGAARGALTGVLLGAGLWAGIIAVAAVFQP